MKRMPVTIRTIRDFIPMKEATALAVQIKPIGLPRTLRCSDGAIVADRRLVWQQHLASRRSLQTTPKANGIVGWIRRSGGRVF